MRDGNGILVGYITANENPVLNLSVQQMLGYDWVRGAVVLDTNKSESPIDTTRLLRVSQDFGSGFDRSVKDGGFDEVAARNKLLDLMYKRAAEVGAEWLLICDSDEYYTAKTGTLPSRLNREGKDIAWLTCWHLVTPSEYTYHERYSALLFGSRMYDPHPRLFRSSVDAKYVPNADLPVVYPDAKNYTQHCHLQFQSGVATAIPGIFHLHLRHMLGKSDVPADHEVRTVSPPIRLPDSYLRYRASIEDTAIL